MKWNKVVLWSIALVALAVGYWTYRAGVGRPALQGPLADLPECGHEDSTVVDPAFAPLRAVPEYHDCQRFIVEIDNVLRYDSLFAIFVSMTAPEVVSALGPPLPAVVRTPNTLGVTPGTTTAVPERMLMAPLTAKTASIALVHADGAYRDLGIVRGMNCLYVYYYLAGAATVWKARMTLASPAPNQCPASTVGQIENISGPELEVKRDPVVDKVTGRPFSKDDYPPVARWDWDAKRKKQYVSVVCDVGWCEIGQTGFTPSPGIGLEGASTPAERRVRLIKGWYDQQLLAKMQNGKPVPSAVLGTIVPHPDLENYNSDADFGKWRDVAYVSLTTSTPEGEPVIEYYRNKLGFKKVAVKDGNPIQLRKETDWGARVRFRLFDMLPLPLGSKNNRVTFRPVPGGFSYEVPGTARWRWKEHDEGSWTRCTQGCCEMSD